LPFVGRKMISVEKKNQFNAYPKILSSDVFPNLIIVLIAGGNVQKQKVKDHNILEESVDFS
jgi:hypothetical protein